MNEEKKREKHNVNKFILQLANAWLEKVLFFNRKVFIEKKHYKSSQFGRIIGRSLFELVETELHQHLQFCMNVWITKERMCVR